MSPATALGESSIEASRSPSGASARSMVGDACPPPADGLNARLGLRPRRGPARRGGRREPRRARRMPLGVRQLGTQQVGEREPALHDHARGGLIAGLVQRLLSEVARLADAAVVRGEHGEAHEHRRPLGGFGELERVAQQTAAAPCLPRRTRGRSLRSPARRARQRARQARAAARARRAGARRRARREPRPARRLRDDLRRLAVGRLGGERDVQRALLEVADQLGQPPVQGAAAVGPQAGGGHRAEQRMREPQPLVVELEHSALQRLLEPARRLVRDRADHSGPRLRQCRHGGECELGGG